MESPVRTAAKIFHCEKSVLDMGNSIVAHHSLSSDSGSVKYELINQYSVSSISRSSYNTTDSFITAFSFGSNPFHPIIIMDLRFRMQITGTGGSGGGTPEYAVVTKTSTSSDDGWTTYSEEINYATTKNVQVTTPILFVDIFDSVSRFANGSGSMIKASGANLYFRSVKLSITLSNIRLRLYGLIF